jgi:hypothetical protein
MPSQLPDTSIALHMIFLPPRRGRIKKSTYCLCAAFTSSFNDHELLQRPRNVKTPPATAHETEFDKSCFTGVGRYPIICPFLVLRLIMVAILECYVTIDVPIDAPVFIFIVIGVVTAVRPALFFFH